MPVPTILRKTKNRYYNFTPSQVKAREATSNDPNGPTDTQLIELAVLSYCKQNFDEILSVLGKRINDDGKNWRHILKSMKVFEFLCLHGSPYILDYCKRNLYTFESLKAFEYFDKDRYDNGLYIRNLAKQFCEILDNETSYNKMKEETKQYTTYVNEALNFNHSSMNSHSLSRSDQSLSNSAYPVRAYKTNQPTNTIYGNQHVPRGQSPRSLESRVVSQEIKQMMPSSKDEEETQLQLALALSKEESHRKQPNQIQIKQKPTTTFEQPKQTNLVDDLLDLNFSSNQAGRSQSVSFQQQQPSFDPFGNTQQSNQGREDPFINKSQQNQFQDPFRSTEQPNPQMNQFGNFQQTGPTFDPFANFQQPVQNRESFNKYQQPVNLFEQPPNQMSQSSSNLFSPPATNSKFSQNPLDFTDKPSFTAHASTSSNQVLNDFLGEFESKLVNMDAFEAKPTYGMKHNFNKSNPFVGFEETKPSSSQPMNSNSNNQFDPNSNFNNTSYNPFGASNPPRSNDPFSVPQTYHINPSSTNYFNSSNNQRNN